jgi:hypothetical protein
MVDLGGDLVIGPHPDGKPWIVGIRDPRAPQGAMASVRLAACAIATSGDYERCMIVDGVRYTHVLDPRTGWPVTGMRSVSVVADRCLVAGTATTVAMLKGACEGARWLDELGPEPAHGRRGRDQRRSRKWARRDLARSPPATRIARVSSSGLEKYASGRRRSSHLLARWRVMRFCSDQETARSCVSSM